MAMSYSPEHPSDAGLSFDDMDHSVLEHYRPMYVGSGGENLVYEAEDHPNTVIKVSTTIMGRILRYNLDHDLPPDTLPEEVRPYAEEWIKKEEQRYLSLKKHFGDEHVLPQKKRLAKIPVNSSIVRRALQTEDAPQISEAWTALTIQRRSAAVDDPKHLTFVSGYSETKDIDPDSYNRLTKQLFESVSSEINMESFRNVQGNEYLDAIIDKAQEDESLRSVIREMVEKMIVYTDETGETLDLAGKDNVIIHQKDGEWTYEIMDALYPGESVLDHFKKLAPKIESGEKLEVHEVTAIMNAVNYIRTVNGLAKHLGLQKTLDLPGPIKKANLDFLHLVEQTRPE